MSAIDPGSADAQALERDLDVGWELLAAQPTHPEVARLATRVLASEPERSSATLLLGHHLEARGETDDARRLYAEVVGRGDRQLVNAMRALRHVAFAVHDHAEALRWAHAVLAEEQEDWRDWAELGVAEAFSGQHDEGWRHLDDAVEMCARTAVDELPTALGTRSVHLLATYAPPDRFVPAAEAAIRADPTNAPIGLLLGWAYMARYAFGDAEQLALRLLREDPTDDLSHGLLETARTMRDVLDRADAEGVTLDDIRRTGVFETAWRQLRDERLGTDLTSALAALDAVMPGELRVTLRPGATLDDEEEAPGAMAADDLVTWRDGQIPGTGVAWGLAEPFRLLSAAEIVAMDAAIQADPASYPEWPEQDVWEPVMTDDAGAHLVVIAFGELVRRRPGAPDEVVAPSMADWVWDRVADFGGRDPRPAPRT